MKGAGKKKGRPGLADESTSARIEELEDEVVSRDHLLSRMAHEVRTPLSTMLMWIRLLRSGQAPDQETGLGAIEESARSLSRVVDDLMDAAYILRGELDIDRVVVDLRPILTSTVRALRDETTSRSIRIDVSIEPAAVQVTGDPRRLARVIHGLLSNAVRLTPDGGHIRVGLQARGDEARLDIVDAGPAPSPELLRHLSLPVHHAVHHGARTDAVGLSLQLARQIVGLHGGALRAAPREDEGGTVLTVTLPLVPGASAAPRARRRGAKHG